MKKLILPLFVLVFFLAPVMAYAKLGVGVGTGKIELDDPIKPGSIYVIPSINVFNTGDETSTYKMNVSYHEGQSELKPQLEWFIFSPDNFVLEPEGAQEVGVKLNLPLQVEPGDYFAYVEAGPVKVAENGETSVAIAAAVKLYFTVEPGSFLDGLYYKAIALLQEFSPWPQIALAGVILLLLFMLLKRFFDIQINFRKKETAPQNTVTAEQPEA